MQGSLATRLRVLRAERGLTLRQVAEMSGVAKETLSGIERGVRHPQDLTLARIAQGYGVPVEDLLETETPKASASPPPESEQPGEERRESEPFGALKAWDEPRPAPPVGFEELSRETARLQKQNERHRRQIDEYDVEGARLPELTWWEELDALEARLRKEYEERGIVGFVRAVLDGRVLATLAPRKNMARACVKFSRELMLMRSHVDEARALVQAAQVDTHTKAIKFRSKLDEGLPTSLSEYEAPERRQ